MFDELQLGTGFVSRQFHYHAGNVTDEHKANEKLKSTPTTQLVSQIVLSGGRTISYEYDAEERITKVTDSIDGVTEYTYDELGQLLTEKHNGEAVNTMVYDNYGNIKSKNGVVYTYGDGVWKDLLTKVGEQTISYDKQGNPTSYLGHTLTWEKGRQLKSFDDIIYTYNTNGIRTSKTVNDIKHTYTLDGTKILRESYGDTALVPMYDNEDSICGIICNDEPYYFQKNLQGDIIAIVDKDAKEIARYSYDAWGSYSIVQDTSDVQIATLNPFRYRGYYFDIENNLYYLNSRYYDPAVGRFVSSDEVNRLGSEDVISTYDLYVYCGYNPILYVDPTGYARFAILYDARQSGYFGGYWRGDGFKKQGEEWYTGLKKRGKEVYRYTFKSIEEFKRKWNTLSNYSYDSVIILAHGVPGSLDCNDERLLCRGLYDDTYTVYRTDGMNLIRTKYMYLFSCNAATCLEIRGICNKIQRVSIAHSLAPKIYNGKLYAVQNGKVDIEYSGGEVTNDKGYWVTIQSGKTNFYGNNRCFAPYSL